MIFFAILLVLTFVAQIAEFFIPPLEWMYNARIYIVPLIVFYGAWRFLSRSCSPWLVLPGFCSM